MKRIIILLLTIAIIVPIVQGAQIQGSVYDFSLEKVPNVILEVDSTPQQRLVSKNGDYTFNLPAGTYTITAKSFIGNETDSVAKEPITIQDEGIYNLDLFLFPALDEYEQLYNESEKIDKKQNITPYIIGAIILLITILLLIRFKLKPKKEIEEEKEEPEDLKKIINVIKREGGRISQKDLRKKFSLSEAKVSLMITELEEKGKIQKIKKGRGNVLILKD